MIYEISDGCTYILDVIFLTSGGTYYKRQRKTTEKKGSQALLRSLLIAMATEKAMVLPNSENSTCTLLTVRLIMQGKVCTHYRQICVIKGRS